jgi:RimJ/RimL family protein N-acetyltransferase
MKLKTHHIILRGENVVLRPMTENDWDLLLTWNSDPEVLYFAEGADVQSYSLDDVQDMYRGVSQTAFCFIIEVDGQPIGECWLQQMNLERILHKYPGTDCRRIDLMIGDKGYWGRGFGTEVIRLLTHFAFEQEHADRVFGCDIGDYNQRSLWAFQKAGYHIDSTMQRPSGEKAKCSYDAMRPRERRNRLFSY